MAYERALAPLVDNVAESAADVDNAYYVLEEMRNVVSNGTEAHRRMQLYIVLRLLQLHCGYLCCAHRLLLCPRHHGSILSLRCEAR